MKNKIGQILSLILLGILIQAQFCSAGTFGVFVGETFTYDCIASNQFVKWTSHLPCDAEGYTIDGQHFDQGTSFSVHIYDIYSDSLCYVVSKNSSEEKYISNGNSLLLASTFDYGYKILMLRNDLIVNGYDYERMVVDPILPIDLVFVETDSSIWNDLIDLAEEKMDYYSTVMAGSNLTMRTDYTNNETTFAFEIHLHGKLSGTDTPLTSPVIVSAEVYNEEINYYFRFAYNKITGALLGMRLYGSMFGRFNDTSSYRIRMDSYIEQEGYNLPAYVINTELFSGYSIAITLGSITTLLVISISIKRKKKSHLN